MGPFLQSPAAPFPQEGGPSSSFHNEYTERSCPRMGQPYPQRKCAFGTAFVAQAHPNDGPVDPEPQPTHHRGTFSLVSWSPGGQSLALWGISPPGLSANCAKPMSKLSPAHLSPPTGLLVIAGAWKRRGMLKETLKGRRSQHSLIQAAFFFPHYYLLCPP